MTFVAQTIRRRHLWPRSGLSAISTSV